MGRVLWHMIMSLDGYIAGPGDEMGWVFEVDSGEGEKTVHDVLKTAGALLVGRRTQDIEDRDQPGFYGGAFRGPFFVLRHDPPDDPPVVKGVSGQFLDVGIADAVAVALAAADGGDVIVLGSSLARQCLEAGLLDEMIVHVAPVLLGGGVRMFERAGGELVKLTPLSSVTEGETTVAIRAGSLSLPRRHSPSTHGLYRPRVISAPHPSARGMATSADGTRIAWQRYGAGERAILFVPTWNIVDGRVVGNQVAALESRATILAYDPRGVGESDRPERGYDFPLHAADALAVLEANGVEHAALVTASRGLNAAVLLIADDGERFDRLAVIAPYMQLEAEPAPPDPGWLESLRTDWPGFIVPFMHSVFTEPDSADVIAEMIAIGLEATPEVAVVQELELEWRGPARLLERVTCPTLVVHGEADAPVPVAHAESIVAAMPNARLEVIPGGGHRPDIRTPELVNPILLDFLLDP